MDTTHHRFMWVREQKKEKKRKNVFLVKPPRSVVTRPVVLVYVWDQEKKELVKKGKNQSSHLHPSKSARDRSCCQLVRICIVFNAPSNQSSSPALATGGRRAPTGRTPLPRSELTRVTPSPPPSAASRVRSPAWWLGGSRRAAELPG